MAKKKPKKTFIELLHERELSLRVLGKKLGLHHTYLSHMANGRRMPTLSRAVKIARAMGVTLDELFAVLPVVPHGR